MTISFLCTCPTLSTAPSAGVTASPAYAPQPPALPCSPPAAPQRPADAPDFNVFNFLQLFDGAVREMQVVHLRREAAFFKMQVVREKMQVVLFAKALLAFLPSNTDFFPRKSPPEAINKGQTAMVCPSADANIRNFPSESK